MKRGYAFIDKDVAKGLKGLNSILSSEIMTQETLIDCSSSVRVHKYYE